MGNARTLLEVCAAFDRRVDAAGRVRRTRRRMKITLLSLCAGAMLVLGEAFGLAVVRASGQSPPLIEYWGPLSAIGVALVAFATMRATFAAHKENIEARMAEKATKDELAGMLRLMESIHSDLRELRAYVEEKIA